MAKLAGESLLDVNGGELRVGFWPSKTAGEVGDLLDAYITEGKAKASGLDPGAQDAAAKEWAYVLAYRGLLAALAAGGPVSFSLVDQGSSATTGDQFQTLRDLIAAHLAAFNTLAIPSTATGISPTTRTVRQDTEW